MRNNSTIHISLQYFSLSFIHSLHSLFLSTFFVWIMRTKSNGNRVPGMLCRSEAATAVCVPRERSVIVPQRAKRSTLVHHEHARLGYDLRYSRLKDSRSFTSGDHRRAVTLPMVTKRQNLQVKPSSTSNDGQLFQVVLSALILTFN